MRTLDLFKYLVSIPSPSGFETEIRRDLRNLCRPFVDKIVDDIHGNLLCYKLCSNSKEAKTIMLIAHMDEIGLMVTYIEETGIIRFSSLGGIDINILLGRRVNVLHEGTLIEGVIGVRPFHMKDKSASQTIELSDLWIDIGCQGKSEVEQLVSVGDYIVMESQLDVLKNDIVVSRGCDNKSGLTVLVKTMELLSAEKLVNNIVYVASVQEEIGFRGARTSGYAVNPDICIAIDVCHATDYPTVNKAKYGDVKLGNGPVIPVGSDFTSWIQKSLKDISRINNIPSQKIALPGNSGTDINAIQVSRMGCATGLISIPCRYMHSPVEMISIQDINNSINILCDFCKSL